MAYQVAAVNEQVYALAIWDESWKSYNNCYLVQAEGRCVLIDCGKAVHGEHLLAALAGLGRAPGDVTHILATHGHKDHIEGYELFAGAVRYIHPADRSLLSEEAQCAFALDLPDSGPVLDYQCVLLGHHTPGSVALFHTQTGTLFAGDHLPFFGSQLPAGGLVSAGLERRERARTFIRGWAQNPEDRTKRRFDLFVDGLRVLERFPARSYCTGHGAVLAGDVPAFLGELAAIGAAPE